MLAEDRAGEQAPPGALRTAREPEKASHVKGARAQAAATRARASPRETAAGPPPLRARAAAPPILRASRTLARPPAARRRRPIGPAGPGGARAGAGWPARPRAPGPA